jgi:phage terminase large subunit-like protein
VIVYAPDGPPAMAFIYSAEEPDRLRGPEHEAAWADEIAAWKYEDTWDNLQFGMRIGSHPRTIATTTPKPVPLVRKLMKRAQTGDSVAITRGRTVDNQRNLSPVFLEEVTARYAGTRLGRQELEGELLEDVEGALWTLANLEQHRLRELPEGVTLKAIVIGVDPAATSNQDSDETGIVAVGAGSDRRGYVLSDLSLIGAPLVWASKAIGAYHAHQANFIVVETNNGGEMVTQTIKTVDPKVPVRPVTASRGKQTRAEPISALYEQGWVSHLGIFPHLEEQMTTWVPGMSSPDRMDALGWGFTALPSYLGHQRVGGLI